MKRFAVVVPTLNAASEWDVFERELRLNVDPANVLIIDSSSTDHTVDLARQSGFRVHIISKQSFNHGGTRQLGAEMMDGAEIIVYLTQDAVLAGANAISLLLDAFTDPRIALAYGRQLPRRGATAIEAHARLHNYPANSSVRSFEDRERFGLKTIFISNSFAAYRRAALVSMGDSRQMSSLEKIRSWRDACLCTGGSWATLRRRRSITRMTTHGRKNSRDISILGCCIPGSHGCWRTSVPPLGWGKPLSSQRSDTYGLVISFLSLPQ